MEIRTIEERDEQAYQFFQLALHAEKSPFINLKQFKEGEFKNFVEKSKRFETQTDHPDWSTSTNYYAFIDGEIAGRIGCRWELDKGDLATVGGHIGYVTSPKFRKQGVMTALLVFALKRYAERGITSVLITARADNLPSRKTIEKMGGQLENLIEMPDGHQLARYWVLAK